MPYELICQGATSAPVITAGELAACSDAGGSLVWIESASIFPELTSADVALLGGKVLLIFAVVFSIRMVYRLILNR